MPIAPDNVSDRVALVKDVMVPALVAERDRLDTIDRWWRWDHDQPHSPPAATNEYKQLAKRAQAPWLGLVVTAVAQALYVEGFRSTENPDNAGPWRQWQANGLDARQIAVHRAALAYGQAFARVLPGEDPITGSKSASIRGISPRNLIPFYEEDTGEDWPVYALRSVPTKYAANGTPSKWKLELYDEQAVYTFDATSNFDNIGEAKVDEHELGVCPIVRFANSLDLEGRADGEVEPFIPLAARIDQTTFDRLVVQRFSSWVVRTIAGMAEPETDAAATKLQLTVDALLVAESPDTKFGSLPSTPLDGFIKAHDADVRDLAALTQTPPHHLLGQMANLSAEALAAAESGLQRKVDERKHLFGESWERTLRLGAWAAGDTEAAADVGAEVRWADTESRSLAQAADALGKLAQMLQVPVELLWEKIPGFTQQDVEQAKTLAASGDGLAAILDELAAGATSPEPVI